MERQPTKELLEVIFLALDHATKSVLKSNGPLVPFAIVEASNGEQHVSRFTTGRNPNEARLHARSYVSQTVDCVRYAIAGDGTLNESGGRAPVVMVEAGQRGEPHGFVFIQRFASTSNCRFAQVLGNPGIIDHPPLLQPLTE